MPDDLRGKIARADALRSELSALRVERETALQNAHEEAHSTALDAELARLEEQVRQEKTALVVATGGSVEDAQALMEAAARAAYEAKVDDQLAAAPEDNAPLAFVVDGDTESAGAESGSADSDEEK